MDVYKALGLSEGEEKVYRALVKIGSSTTGPLYKEANVSQSKVYEILERLKKKGLASSIIKSGIVYWQAGNPSIYLDKLDEEFSELKERKEILKKELPKLIERENKINEEAHIYEGYNGFRTALNSFLESFKSGEELIVFGSPKPIPEPFYSFLVSYNKERVKRRIKGRWLYGKSMKDFAGKLYNLPLTNVKYIEGMTPASIAIGKDRIILLDFENEGKTTVIMSNMQADNFKKFFESLWKIAKK